MRPKILIRLSPIFFALALALALAGLANALGGGTLASADAQFTGEAADDGAGYRALAGVGDVNGDGYDDMLIGAPYSNSGAGAAYLVFGAPGGWGLNTSLAHASIIKYTGEEASEDYAGSSVAGAGDVNGDGYDDMLIGAPGKTVGDVDLAGAAYLVLGAADLGGGILGQPGDIMYQYSGEGDRDRAGIAVAGAGDVNGDGYADFLVGADGNDDGPGGNAGAAYLVLGGASLNGGSLGGVGIQYTGEADRDGAGRAVAGAGDVNGDGYADLLVGASRVGSKDIGAAYVVLGGASLAGGSLAGGGNTIYKYTGERDRDYAGTSVAGAGDVNGDGFDDLLIGADGNDAAGSDSGAAYLVLGGGSLQGGSLNGIGGDTVYKYGGANWGNYAGASVAGAGDVNGDGYADLLIGADGNDDGPGDDAGAAYLVLGGASLNGGNLDGTGGDTIVQYTGEADSDFAGSAVAGVGDVNRDGYADLLVGADSNDDGGVDAGAAYLFFSDFLAPGNSSVRQRHRLPDSANPPLVTFDQAGVRVNFIAGAVSQGEVIVERHIFHPCDTSMRLQMPIWTINSNKFDVGSGSTLEIWFDYTDEMITGMAEESLAVWKRPDGQHCTDWTQVVGTVTRYPELNRVKVLMSGVTGLSQFTLADAPPSPTAVRMVSMGTHLAQEPLWLVILLAMLVLSSGATYWYLRQQEERTLATSQAHDLTDVIAAKVAALLRRPSEE